MQKLNLAQSRDIRPGRPFVFSENVYGPITNLRFFVAKNHSLPKHDLFKSRSADSNWEN